MGKETYTILLIDDEDMVLNVVSQLLGRIGYRVIGVNSGRKAIDEIKNNDQQIDIVILDMLMPEMNGQTTFYQIRAIKPNIPIIIASGYHYHDQIEDVMSAGCNGFIPKPYSASELHPKIQQILQTDYNK